jgi:hypothetical protein
LLLLDDDDDDDSKNDDDIYDYDYVGRPNIVVKWIVLLLLFQEICISYLSLESGCSV